MRPRVFPAEDSQRLRGPADRRRASMRPRVFPAEDGDTSILTLRSTGSFNEAAGIPRGRPHSLMAVRSGHYASMRPRVFPAEDVEESDRVATDAMASMRPRVFPAEDGEAVELLGLDEA